MEHKIIFFNNRFHYNIIISAQWMATTAIKGGRTLLKHFYGHEFRKIFLLPSDHYLLPQCWWHHKISCLIDNKPSKMLSLCGLLCLVSLSKPLNFRTLLMDGKKNCNFSGLPKIEMKYIATKQSLHLKYGCSFFKWHNLLESSLTNSWCRASQSWDWFWTDTSNVRWAFSAQFCTRSAGERE